MEKMHLYLSCNLKCIHPAYSPDLSRKRNFCSKTFLYLRKKANFLNQINLTPASENWLSTQKTCFLYLPKNITNFSPKGKLVTTNIYQKNNFPNKKFLYLSEKLISSAYTNKLKGFISDVLWVWPCYFLC